MNTKTLIETRILAEEIAKAAISLTAYSMPGVRGVDRLTEYHRESIRQDFANLAKTLGYRIVAEPIETSVSREVA